VDPDAFEAVHAAEWRELDQLVRRRRLTGEEADRLVTLYQRTATHLSQVRSAAPDPVLVGRLSRLLARTRTRLTGSRESAWRDLRRFAVVSCPAALYRIRWLVLAVTVVFLLVSTAVGGWVVTHPDVQAALLDEEATRRLVEVDFAAYYTEYPATSFAFEVWTHNAWLAAQCIGLGITGLWPLLVLGQNAVSVGQVGGVMVANDRAAVFFGLITPHGLLEITAFCTAAAAGLRLFWAWVDPGPRPRLQAVAQEGRATFTVAGGLACALALSGLVEAVVTPSALPTWARVSIGMLASAAFVAYALVLGGRAVRVGETGDLSADQAGEYRPVTG
jgi:uncharacterized membrane protein SpoIIM required for sporulation